MVDIATRRPADDDHAPAQTPHGDDADLAVIAPVVLVLHHHVAFEHLDRIGEVEHTLLGSGGPLRRIERDVHETCIYKIRGVGKAYRPPAACTISTVTVPDPRLRASVPASIRRWPRLKNGTARIAASASGSQVSGPV